MDATRAFKVLQFAFVILISAWPSVLLASCGGPYAPACDEIGGRSGEPPSFEWIATAIPILLIVGLLVDGGWRICIWLGGSFGAAIGVMKWAPFERGEANYLAGILLGGLTWFLVNKIKPLEFPKDSKK